MCYKTNLSAVSESRNWTFMDCTLSYIFLFFIIIPHENFHIYIFLSPLSFKIIKKNIFQRKVLFPFCRVLSCFDRRDERSPERSLIISLKRIVYKGANKYHAIKRINFFFTSSWPFSCTSAA